MIEFFSRIVKADTVQLKEDQRGRESRSLVTIDERMILSDMESVGRRHLEQVRMKKPVLKRGIWHCHRGRKKVYVTNAGTPAIPF